MPKPYSYANQMAGAALCNGSGGMVKKVITYGTFDLFHIGHVRLLERLSHLGDHLTVCVSTDEFNAIKNKQSVMPYAQRAEIVAACRFVDEVLPEQSWDQKRLDISRKKIGVFAMGDDWLGKFDDLRDICEVVYLPRTQDISTSFLKEIIRENEPEAPISGKTEVKAAGLADAQTFEEILKHARKGRISYKNYRHYREILGRGQSEQKIDWLKCWILLFCLVQKKPIKTRNYISKFCEISRRRKRTREYSAFMKLLFTDLGLMLPGGGKYSPSLGAANIGDIITQSKALMDRLAVYDREIFANSGTLLGLVRNGTLLAHDYDVDLGMLLKARTEVEAAAEWREITDRLIADGLALHRSEWSHVTLKMQKIGDFGVDLFPAWCDAQGRLFVYPHTYGTLTRDQLLPLRTDPMTMLSLPRDPEAMLASNYGERWRVPNEGWRFNWPVGNANFAKLLELMKSGDMSLPELVS